MLRYGAELGASHESRDLTYKIARRDAKDTPPDRYGITVIIHVSLISTRKRLGGYTAVSWLWIFADDKIRRGKEVKSTNKEQTHETPR